MKKRSIIKYIKYVRGTWYIQYIESEATSKHSGLSPLIDNVTSAKISYGPGCGALVEKHEQSGAGYLQLVDL
jgi:hypothetical protein